MPAYPRIPRTFIDDLLTHVNIIDIISPRIALRNKGGNHSAICPFHLEKTPSFTVSESKQFYHCFGCGVHGNVIDFLMAYDRLQFVEAIETLAAYSGLQIPRELAESTAPPDYADTCQNLGLAADFYHKQLFLCRKAVDYVKSRGLNKEIVKKYGIGYAPPGWDNLLKNMASSAGLLTGGMLIKKDQGGFYDRFRDRILFPIRNHRGHVIAFGGRTLGDEMPKYLNSPETTVFHKGKELYGFYEARQANPQLSSFIVVEGYMDVIALAQHGFNNAVATLGTAVSQQHIRKLLGHARELFFCFDGDRAGRQAAWRALEVSLPLLRDDIRLRFVFLAPEDDPDTVIRREGSSAFQTQLEQALALPDFFFSELSKQANPSSLEGRSHLAKLAKDLLDKIPEGIFKQLMYDELAKQVQIDVACLLDPKNGESDLSTQPPALKKQPQPNASNSIQLATSLLLQHPDLAQKLKENELSEYEGSAQLRLLIELIRLLKHKPSLSSAALLEHWRDREHADLLAHLMNCPHLLPKEAFVEEFMGAIRRIKNQQRQQRIQALLNKAKTAELLPDEKKALQELILNK